MESQYTPALCCTTISARGLTAHRKSYLHQSHVKSEQLEKLGWVQLPGSTRNTLNAAKSRNLDVAKVEWVSSGGIHTYAYTSLICFANPIQILMGLWNWSESIKNLNVTDVNAAAKRWRNRHFVGT